MHAAVRRSVQSRGVPAVMVAPAALPGELLQGAALSTLVPHTSQRACVSSSLVTNRTSSCTSIERDESLLNSLLELSVFTLAGLAADAHGWMLTKAAATPRDCQSRTIALIMCMKPHESS